MTVAALDEILPVESLSLMCSLLAVARVSSGNFTLKGKLMDHAIFLVAKVPQSRRSSIKSHMMLSGRYIEKAQRYSSDNRSDGCQSMQSQGLLQRIKDQERQLFSQHCPGN